MSGAGNTVCVTGGSVYIASWLVKFLLQRGYTVKASVRDHNNPKKQTTCLNLMEPKKGFTCSKLTCLKMAPLMLYLKAVKVFSIQHFPFTMQSLIHSGSGVIWWQWQHCTFGKTAAIAIYFYCNELTKGHNRKFWQWNVVAVAALYFHTYEAKK